MPDLKIRTVKVSQLTPDPQNVRTHDATNIEAIRRSLDSFGQRKPLITARGNDGSLVVIAGNGTLEAAKQLGWDTIAIAEVPDDWDADKARAYAIADNRTAELADWDKEGLASALIDLDAVGWSMDNMGFMPGQLDPIDPESGDALNYDETYTKAINIPQYEIRGEQPHLIELVNTVRYEKLCAEIRAAVIDEDVREFLLTAATRHIVFNYRKAAEYYPHASPEVQRLMEDSAMVIIDPENAIRNGYANFMDTVTKLEEQDR